MGIPAADNNGIKAFLRALAIHNILVMSSRADAKYVHLISPSHPLLITFKRLKPGTFSHSILVGFAAASAAAKIGANPYLARAIGYYHDIGKIRNPQIFPELPSGDRIETGAIKNEEDLFAMLRHPSDSCVILAQNGFPPEIFRAAMEHHGTSYTRRELSAELKKRFFGRQVRYSGPKPSSIESAIVMLTDSCENALGGMKRKGEMPENPAGDFIRGVIRRIGTEIRSDGQFDECGLTVEKQGEIEEAITELLYRYYNKLDIINIP